MKKLLFAATFILCLTGSYTSLGNNLEITETPEVISIDTDNKTATVTFGIKWENSWRNDIPGAGYEEPYNHDAVWIFLKYKDDDDLWMHATLNESNHSVPGEAEINIPTDRKGAFILKSENGYGTNDWQNINIIWNYGDDEIDKIKGVNIKVFAIEMVYIPQGSFYLGDEGETERVWRQFHKILDDETTETPFEITSEDGFTLGGTTQGNLGNHDNFSENPVLDYDDDFDNSTTQWLPDAFPKGYNGFYIMKHEITQKQYVDFLNALTRTQQDTRTYTDLSGTNVTNVYVMTNTSSVFGSYRNGIRVQTPIENTTDPLTFFCDLNENGIPNEDDDGLHIASNYLGADGSASYSDVQAYLFWAGLRPMTELEYEKAARGSSDAPWSQGAGLDIAANGQLFSNLVRADGPVEDQENPGRKDELIINPPDANAAHRDPSGFPGPYRVGIFAKDVTDRVQSGASYYGVMELSGNLLTPVIPVSNGEFMNSRAYTGLHGDGNLDNQGDPKSDFLWPIRLGCKGGSFNLGNRTLRVTERNRATAIINYRTYNWQTGGRGVRTAE